MRIIIISPAAAWWTQMCIHVGFGGLYQGAWVAHGGEGGCLIGYHKAMAVNNEFCLYANPVSAASIQVTY